MSPWLARRMVRRSVVIWLAGVCVIAVGVGALLGWMLDAPLLKGSLPGLAEMKANTAVGFTALGASLVLTRLQARPWAFRTGRVLAASVAVVGALTLAEYVLGRNLGLDQLLFQDLHAAQTEYPGRPSPQAAVLFAMLGIALWMLHGHRVARSHVPRALAGTSCVIAAFAVIGYAYGISKFTEVPSLNPLALYSALTFMLLCGGIDAADPNGLFAQLCSHEASAVLVAKRLLPVTVVVFPILGWLQIQGGNHGLYSTATGVALLVLISTLVLFLSVLSVTKQLSRRDVQRRIGIEREARLAALVEASHDAVWSTDLDGIIISWNRAAEALYGYAEPEAVGHSISLLTRTAEADRRRIHATVTAGQPCTDVEIQSGHKDGTLIDTSVTISRIMRDDEVIGFCGVSHDISSRVRARDELEQNVRQRTRDLSESRIEILQRLALAAEYRDDDTARHTQRVGRGASQLAQGLGLPDDIVHRIGLAAPLHDVGKIGIPDSVLLKPGALTAEEFDAMKRHTVLGARLLTGSSFQVLQLGEQIALTHHERWDGSGYPAGLRGDAIPIAGRIVAVVDSYDAMTNDRPYRPARTSGEALDEISRCSGTLFDPQVAAAFLRRHGRPGHDPPAVEVTIPSPKPVAA